MKVQFEHDVVSFRCYPFPGSTVYGAGDIPYSAIRDVDPGAYPPEIRTVEGETLFINAEQQSAFQDVVRDKSLKVVHRLDVWYLMLEPFLDTEFSAAHNKQTLQRLHEVGMTEGEVQRIRKEVEASMISYNLFLWEWCHLGLFDVLYAVRNSLTLTAVFHQLSPKCYARFYWDAMRTAELGYEASASGATDPTEDEVRD